MSDFSLLTFLIVCPLVGLAGFVDSIAGGGGLISLPAFLLAGLPVHAASATNKLAAIMGASVSFANYAKKGFIKFKLAIPCCLIAVCFASVGAKLQLLIPENFLKIVMLILLPATLIIILNKKSLEPDDETIIDFTPKQMLVALLISVFAGLYDGIYGPGTGTFLLILFVNILKMNIKDANGLAKAINFSTNLGALVTYFFSNKAIILLGVCAGICNMIGSYIGSNLFAKKGVKVARPIMITVIMLFMLKIIFELVIAR